MAAARNNSPYVKHAKKAAKNAHHGIVAIGILFLILGAIIGYYGAGIVTKEDHFTLKGEREITVPLGSMYTYHDEGVDIVSLGRDLSDQVIVTTDLEKDAAGDYIVNTSVEATYTITYTVEDIKYKDFKRIRTICVTGGES